MGSSSQRPGPRYSEDRKWWWTGTEWVPAARAPKPQFSPDRRWWWNGLKWVPAPAPSGAVGAKARVGPSNAQFIVVGAVVLVLLLLVLVAGGISVSLVASRTGVHPQSTPNTSTPGTSVTGGPGLPTTRPQAVTHFEVWRDPTEAAFKAILPSGWTATGGVRRPYFGGDLNFAAQDPTRTISVYFQSPGYPYFVEPSPPTDLTCQEAPATPICNEGTTVLLAPSNPASTAVVWHYLQAQEFVATKVLTELRAAHPDARLVTSNARPELSKQTLIYILATRVTGADALFEYSHNGIAYQEGVVVTTDELATPSGSIWYFTVAGVSAPKSEFASSGVTAFAGILPTVTVDLNWLIKELQDQSASTALIQQASDFLKQQDYREFLSISESNASVGEAWANALGGVELWQNPETKEYFNLLMEPGADYVWYCGTGITRTSVEQSPNPAGCVEMRRAQP